MKKKILFAVSAMALSYSGLQAQDEKETPGQSYYRLAQSNNAEDRALVTGKMYDLLQSKTEGDWMMAIEIFNVLGKKATADSAAVIVKERYPGGQFMRNEEVKTISKGEHRWQTI